MARFDDNFLEELTSRADIEDVVSRYTSLVRKGGRLWALCPFHSEKTPSFSVTPEKQAYYCFGCGKGGGVISFIMDAERLDFAEAVEFLANLYNLELPGAGHEKRTGHKKRLLEINLMAARFFRACFEGAEGEPARNYAAQRRLSPKTLARFGIGYAPPGWDSLSKHLTSKGCSPNELIEAGLCRRGRNGGIYDIFRDRLIFPIIDKMGRVVAFGGRAMPGSDSPQKYLNTSDTPIYSKKTNLYALNIAKNTKSDKLILVEGYMDAVALHQAGFDFAVASLGTALTPEQAKLIKNSTGAKEVIISYDADAAGQAAAERAVGVLSGEDFLIRILKVPGGKDPDGYIKEFGAASFEELLQKSAEQMEYRLSALKTKFDLGAEADRIQYVREAAKLLATAGSRIGLEVYAGRVAEETGISREAVIAESERRKKSSAAAARKKQHAADMSPERRLQPPRDSGVRYENPVRAAAEEELISLLTRHNGYFSKVSGQILPEDFSSGALGGIFFTLLKKIEAGIEISPDVLAGELSPDELRLYSRIIARDLPHENPEKQLSDLLFKLTKDRRAGEGDPLLTLREMKRVQRDGG